MPPPQKVVTKEGISGVLNLKGVKVGRRGGTKWKKKFAIMRADTLHLYEGQDENGRGEDESHTIYLSKYKECTQIMDKKGKKKACFTLIPTDTTYDQWMFSCDDVNEHEKWINQLNMAITGNVITIIDFNLDDLKIVTPVLHHLSKSRPKCKGRRAPSKRPRMDTYSSEHNGECVTDDDDESGVTHVDAGTPAKKARSDLTPTTPSPTATAEESKASGAKAFFRGIGLKVSTALGRQKTTGAKTPQSPEPRTVQEIQPEERMSLSSLLRTLQHIETTSGTIINKAAAPRLLFQGSAADSAGLGQPAKEVEKGLQGMTDALQHLNLAESLQQEVKENEERERMSKEELARKKREEEEELGRQKEEERKKKEAEEAEQRRQDEEEQELKDEEDRQREEERLKKEEEDKRAEKEALRLAKEVEAEEEKILLSEDEKNESDDMVDQEESAAMDATQGAEESSKAIDDGPIEDKELMITESPETDTATINDMEQGETVRDQGDTDIRESPSSPKKTDDQVLEFNDHL